MTINGDLTAAGCISCLRPRDAQFATHNIDKGDGRKRPLGIPTVSDRIAQTVVKRYLEPILEPIFHADSYGYRLGRSAHQALSVARQRCWRFDWVLDFDIKGFYDNIDHELLMRALRRHTRCKWVLLYIERWLRAPVRMPDGTLMRPEKGTPQGSVVSPILGNLFLHYAFDRWMQEHHSEIPFERYADDAICHCRDQAQAHSLREALETRLAACKLELHPQKTQIVYCKDANRTGDHPAQRFDFLGYTFRPRRSMNRNGKLFVSFAPAISNKAAKAIRHRMRRWKLHHRNDLALADIARWTRPFLLGWIRYYGRFHRSALSGALRTLNSFIVRWAQRKYKRLRGHTMQAWDWLRRLQARQPALFAHWITEPAVGRKEPDESRGSRPVLGGRGGAIPSRYSPTCTPTRPAARRVPGSHATSAFTTHSAAINRLVTERRMRCTTACPRPSRCRKRRDP